MAEEYPVTFLYSPRFPVVNAAPTQGAVIRNFSFRDWLTTGATGLGAGVMGYIVGKPLRRFSCYTMLGFGLFIGFLGRFRASHYRLAGQLPNEAECRAAGIEFVRYREDRRLE
mmetsp:Transcript_18824/g.36545  ORF Transcript_18824/g.36545 Transcript_18824/m.36545 type:complete len:113 (+) Transcript_18824:87-425(+)